MTCTQFKRELKCKFPPCQCQKCSKLRGENGRRMSSAGNCPDTPPERPIPKYRFQCKCTCEPKVIGPKYQRNCLPLPQPQRKPASETKRSCSEVDDCNTGKGCCNTGRNFLAFMINMIGFVACVIISAIVLWLLVFQWTVILGVKVYHSNRTTQVAVVSVISLLFVMILYSAGVQAIRRRFARPTPIKLPPTPSPPPAPQKPPKKEASSMFSFNWVRSKEIDKEPEAHSTWLPSFRWRTETKTTEERSSWMSSLRWGHSKETKVETVSRTSWVPSYRWSWNQPKETKTEAKTQTSWMPSFRWSWSRSKDSKKEPETRSSWLPSFRSTKSAPKAETPSSWLDFINWNKKQIDSPPKSSSWMTSFTWYHSTTKTIEHSPKPPARLIWSPWTFDWGQSGVQRVKTKPEKNTYSWIPSFLWGHTEGKKKKKTPCKTACNRSPCESKKQKVTVTITDEEARQIFKQSKLYAIPTEMKQPPALIIYLRDLIQRNTD